MNEHSTLTQSERDLLIELRTQMIAMREDLRELKIDSALRLKVVEEGKFDRHEAARLKQEIDAVHDDHEMRLRANEKTITQIATWGAAGVLALQVTQFIVGILIR